MTAIENAIKVMQSLGIYSETIVGIMESAKIQEKENIKKAWDHGNLRVPENLRHVNNSELYFEELYYK